MRGLATGRKPRVLPIVDTLSRFAGEDMIGPFLTDRQQFVEHTVKPLREKTQTVYVARGTDAEDFVARSLPHKRIKVVRSGLPWQRSIRGFLRALPLVFQRGRSKGLKRDPSFHLHDRHSRPNDTVRLAAPPGDAAPSSKQRRH
jgi:hypothetical protein